MSSVPSHQSELHWPSGPLAGEIHPAEIAVWAWTFPPVSAPSEDDLNILSESERHRTRRFLFAPDRVRYSASHANMRRILASYLRKSPESLLFRERAGGKPELDLGSGELPIRFNLSHSKTAALLAVSVGQELGVDIEDIRPIERDVALRFFSPAEITAMDSLTGQEWLDAFYRCWTRKEAILKAEGQGLRIPLNSFDVSVLARQPAALLAIRPDSTLTANWHLCDLSPRAGCKAALAVGNEPSQVTTRRFQPDLTRE